jgi:hypothetical protein
MIASADILRVLGRNKKQTRQTEKKETIMKSMTRITRTAALVLGLAAVSMLCVSCSSDDDKNPVNSGGAAQINPAVANTVDSYVTNHRWGGANGLWRYAIPMEVTPHGDVYYNGKLINNPTLGSKEIGWSMADGNATNVWMAFAEGSDADFFWRDSVRVDERCAMGWIQNPGEGKLDFRALAR